MSKLIYVCCGTGIATSTMMANKIKKALDDAKIDYSISKYTVREVASQVKQKKPALIVSSSDISEDVGDVPVVNGKSLITNIGKDKTLNEILGYLK